MGILVNFAAAFLELERYFYDPATDEILTYNGEQLKTAKNPSRSRDIDSSGILSGLSSNK